MLRRDIAASSLKIVCKNFNPLKSYGKTNMTVFVLSLWEKYRWGSTLDGKYSLNSLNQGYRNFEIQIGPLDWWRHRRYTNMSSTIPNSHENSSFSSKSLSEMDYFSDTVQLQPVVSKRSRDNPKSLATDRCLIQGSINIRCGVWIHLFFQCP